MKQVVTKKSWVMLVLLSVLVSLISASLVTWAIVESRRSQLNTKLSAEADYLMGKMVERVTLYQYGLRGVRAFVLSEEAGNGLSREDFKNYSVTRDYAKEFPGARGFGFIRRVAAAQESQFIERARADNFPEFSVRQLQPHNDERYVIQYLEPLESNRAAIGLDIASEQHRRAAAQRAIATGETQLTGPITLVQVTGQPQQAFLLLMPVYRSWATPKEPAERWQEAIGWTYSPLAMHEILGSVNVNTEFFRLRLSDATDPANTEVFYSLNESATFGQVQERTTLVFGRNWKLELSGTPALAKSLHTFTPGMVFVSSLLISAVVCALLVALFSYWQTRSKLFRQASRLASFVEGSSDAIVGTDLSGIIRSWNKGAEAIFGFRPEEALGKQVIDLLVPAGFEAEDVRLYRLMKEGKGEGGLVTRRQRKNGEQLDALVNVEPIFNDKQQVIGGSQTIRDISAIKRVEQELKSLNSTLENQVSLRTQELSLSLKQNEALLELQNSILASSSSAIIATDTEGLITVFNPAAEALLGYSAEEMIGLQSPAIFHDLDEVVSRAQEFSQELGETVAPGFDVFVIKSRYNLPNEYEWTYIHKNQTRIPVMLSVTALRNAQGNISGYLGMAADISQQKADKQNLIDAKITADSANDAKSQFLANMSHEIRTPMNGVLGMLELVKRTSLTHQQKDYVTKADSAARSLLGILNDILDFSKISAGKMTLDPTEFEVENVLAELGIILAGNLAGKSVEIVLDRDPHLPDILIGDRLRLLQVLINLAGNALKFTEMGHVIIRMELLEKHADKIVMRVEVEDTGIGMSPEQQTHLFESFAQAEASTTRRYGGTGLGLVISKRLLELMGSDLKLESRLAVGSRFWFDLTLGYKADYLQQVTVQDKNLTNNKVLVVDDSPLIADFLQEGLTEKGWRVVKVHSALAALAELERSAQLDEPFDVVLMDWNMPGMNGFEACTKIRAAKEHSALPQIIMITAHEKELFNEVELAGQQPFDQLLVKPVTICKTHELLQACIKSELPTSMAPALEPSTSAQPLAGIKLLVVEDNELNQQVAAELLTLAGAEVTIAPCGLDGVAKAAFGKEHYDLVLMDIQMPDIDGLEATKRIRSQRRLSNLPIIAMTANASEADRQACLEAGMNDHIAKPFDMNKLAPLIRRYCGLMSEEGAVQQPQEQAIEIGNNQSNTQRDGKALTEPVAEILARFSGNKALAARMRDRFRKEIEGLIAKMNIAFQANNQAELTSVFHSIKGVAATLGAVRLASVAADLEAQNQQGNWASEDAITALRNLSAQSVLALEQLDFDSDIVEETINLSTEQLRSLLEEIRLYLSEDNMSAMTLAEKLVSIYGSQAEVKRFYEQVEALNFSAAQDSLPLVEEVLLNGKN